MALASRRRGLLLVLGLATIAVLAQLALASRAVAAPAGLSLHPVSARNEPNALGGQGVVKGAAIDTFKYIVNVDNTGTTTQRLKPDGSLPDGCNPLVSASYPGSCAWTSIAGVPGSSPIATQGDQSDFLAGATVDLPDGRYVVSVLADGFKLDGEHFTITGGVVAAGPLNADGQLVVELQPTPVPDATVRALVFKDTVPTNGAPDPTEDGLKGFEGQLTDYIGQIITDTYGNPICTKYDGENPDTHVIDPGQLDVDGAPVVAADQGPTPDNPSTPGHCQSDVNGILTIPHMGTNRYALSVTPPNGQPWIQTSTLEGNHDWDSWNMEGGTGYDTEFVVAGEPVPTAVFGFVQQKSLPSGPAGHITGVVDAFKAYVPPTGGLNSNGLNGGRIDHPIDRPWVALSDLNGGDQAVYVGRGNPNGTFDIPNVPDGTYSLVWWDDPQDYILDLRNVTVANGQVEDLGVLPLFGWWTQFEGHVFNDLNSNGKRDAGEPGVKDFGVVMKKRENSVMDRGGISATTAADGSYYFENGYPMTQWLVMEAYSDRYYTTGVTYQADNQPDETTILGAGVDISVLPIIGLSGRVDWGVKPYAPGKNGGIVGTVSYDTTRNELDPRFAAVEDWQPGIPDLPVNLYAPVPCGTNAGAPCDTTPAGDEYEVVKDGPNAGAYVKGTLINQYITETWERPGAKNGDGVCIARDVDGNRIPFSTGQLVTNNDTDCLEGPLMGVQFQAGFSTVDGNYGFGDGCFGAGGFDPATGACATGDATPLPAGDYLVEVGIPEDSHGRPLYKVTREEDINIGNGDQTVPQIPPPACAGPLHTVDVAGDGTDGYPDTLLPNGVTVPASAPTDNPTFLGILGSPYEGQQKPLCDTKLVTVANQRSIAPTFNLFTDVPIPGRFWGLVVDDLNVSADKKSLLYGEKAGVAFAPVGIYDYTNRLVTTVESDFNGLFDVLLPSTNRINCPTPSGVCSNVYRFVGNDPGVPGRLNPNYKPEYRTIAAEFEAFPGLIVPADLAPTQVGVSVQLPGGQTHRVMCALDAATPQLMSVSKPYMDTRSGAGSFSISGQGFGSATGSVTLDGTTLLPTTAWSGTQITVSVPAATAQGPHQLDVVSANGQRTVNGITFHVLGASYDPHVYEVGPGKTYAPANSLPATADHAIQNAIDAAAASTDSRPDLVVVYPGLATADNPRVNPRGAYYENLVLTQPVKIQGVGPGGVRADGSTVPGAIIDGGAFGGDSPVATDWQTRVGGLTWAGNQNVNDGAVITLYATAGAFADLAPNAANRPSIDGLDIRGGDQQGFPTNINEIGGGPTGLPPAIVTQGGAIFANAYVRSLNITNNVVQNNGGGYGTIRIGTPDLPAPDTDNHNTKIRIAKNRIIDNAGTNLAGGIGLFAGSDDYDVAGNDICGNFSAEYGGGISAFGLSPRGQIRDNRIYFNSSYDEGGGVIIAGQLPTDPSALSPGSGPVTITRNLVQANLANDDGGGIRFLMAGNFPMDVSNNMIVNNVSTHEGGGVALDDAPAVRFVNNTVMRNITTATAATSDGSAAPAGLSTGQNSAALQATPGVGAFSDPVLFNNVFWDNRAGHRVGTDIQGLNDTDAADRWDMGVTGLPGANLSPTNSVLETLRGTNASATNSQTDPNVISEYAVSVDFAAWRTNPNFIAPTLVAVDLPPNLLGDYHLKNNASPAVNLGAASKGAVSAPATDIDNQPRPALGGFDAGADELVGTLADLSITKTDGRTLVARGQQLTYTIVVSNLGPASVAGAPVIDTLPAGLTSASWTCVATLGSCASASGTGSINTTVDLPRNGTATFTVTATVAAAAAFGPLANTASVTTPSGVSDPSPANNTATDTDTVAPGADLRITKTDNSATATPGSITTYQIVVTNLSTTTAATAHVTDNPPAGMGGTLWTCSAPASSSSCRTTPPRQATTLGTGAINRDITVGANTSVTFTLSGSVGSSIFTTNSLVLSNTATVSAINVADPNPANDTSTDTDSVRTTLRDNFNRANNAALGGNWSVPSSGIGVNLNQAVNNNAATRQAIWNPSTFNANQSASLTFANASTPGLIMKAGGGSTASPTRYILVRYSAGSVVVSTTTNSGTTLTPRGTATATFASGDTLTAAAYSTGVVRIFKNDAFIGQVSIPTSVAFVTGTGRAGILLPPGARIDDFRAGNL